MLIIIALLLITLSIIIFFRTKKWECKASHLDTIPILGCYILAIVLLVFGHIGLLYYIFQK